MRLLIAVPFRINGVDYFFCWANSDEGQNGHLTSIRLSERDTDILLDHQTAFGDYQPVGLLFDFYAETSVFEKPVQRPKRGGILPATMIETDEGFRQARALRPGDMVQTFDGGLREVQNIRHRVPRLTAMVTVPVGALGNDAELELPSETLVALDLETADRLFGTPVVLAKVISLVGYRGITTALPQCMARVHLEFEEEELLWIEGGMLVDSLCSSDDRFYSVLSLTETRQLLASEENRALTHAGSKDPLENALEADAVYGCDPQRCHACAISKRSVPSYRGVAQESTRAYRLPGSRPVFRCRRRLAVKLDQHVVLPSHASFKTDLAMKRADRRGAM
jgi:hypothetical protein